MFCYSVKSKDKVFHNQSCYKAKFIKEQNMQYFYTVDEAREKGYKYCLCCSPLSKKLRAEEKALVDFCQKNGVLYFKSNDYVEIYTNYSSWRLVVSEAKNLRLYHKNEHVKLGKAPMPGYHRQKFKGKTILSYFEYIVKHDAYRIDNPQGIKVSKTSAQKGSKRWRKEQNAIKKKIKRHKAWRVHNLIDHVSRKASFQAV